MMMRFKELYKDIKYIANEYHIDPVRTLLPRTERDEAEMERVVNVYAQFLRPFATMTSLAQGSSFPSLPVVARFVLPIVSESQASTIAPKQSDNVMVKNIKDIMKKKLQKHFRREERALMYATLYLDPLFAEKLHDYETDAQVIALGMAIVETRLIELVDQYKAQQEREEQITDAQADDVPITQLSGPGSPTTSLDKSLRRKQQARPVVGEDVTCETLKKEYEQFASSFRDEAKIATYDQVSKDIVEDEEEELVGDALHEARSKEVYKRLNDSIHHILGFWARF